MNRNSSGYERTSGPLRRDRSPGQGERPSRRPAPPGEGTRQPRSSPPTEPPFQNTDDFAPAAPSAGLFKSPFPSVPNPPSRRRVQERLAYEDEPGEAVDEEFFLPPRWQRSRADTSGSRRPRSGPAAELAAPAGEELDRFALPPRSGRDWEDGAALPRRGSRNDARGLGGPLPPGKSPGRSTRKEVGRRPRKMMLKALLAIFLLGGCSGTSFAVAKFYEVYAIAQSVTGKALPNVGTTKGNVQPGALPDTLSGIKAFNVLLLGSDNDAKFGAGAVLTQTDIVVRVDLANHKVTMVSIPRDMWLTSDEGTCCYKLDEISGAETAGPSTPLLNGLAHTVATIEDDFGIPISAYAWVGLQGFVNVINTLGGVDVDVLHPILDDAYPKDLDPNGNPYAYQRLYIPAGPQHLDGEQALGYVRSRHSDLTGDFGRAARQQSVLVALKKKLDSGTIVSHLGALANDLKNSVITSLTIPQVLSLANFARGLSSSDFIQKVLSVPTYGYSDVVGGKDVIQPDWGAINTTIKQIFSDSAPPVVNLHNMSANDKQTVAGEGATILVENGTTMAGVAAQLTTDLKDEGFNVVQATNADSDTYQTTQIEEFKPASGEVTQFDGTCQVLSKLLGVMYQVSPQAPPAGVDVVIIVGSDTAAQIQQQP